MMKVRQCSLHLGLVLLLFFLLSLAHSVWIPLNDGTDELAHFKHIRFVAQ